MKLRGGGMKVAICDEDRASCSGLRCLVRTQEPDCEVQCFYSGRQFLETKQHFDILLLETQLEDMSGMDVARALRAGGENTILIFVTARREYASEAFEVAAFHYLLKPVSQEKFRVVFESACRQARGLSGISGSQLFFRTKYKSFTVPRGEILYVASSRRQVEIHTLREYFTVYGTMKHMEEELGEGFYRCHRGYLVNMAYVAGYEAGSVRLKNGEEVYLAREKYADFVKVYTEYLRQAGTTLL